MAKIKRIGVIKTASFLGMFGVFVGLIVGIIMFVAASIFSSAISNIAGLEGLGLLSIFGLSGSIIMIILLPLAYGIMSFLIGLIFTPIMNLSLKIINGLNLDIEMSEPVAEMKE